MKYNLKDLKERVNYLNKKFKKSDKTYVKFGLHQAYGGTQVVLKNNKSGGIKEVTYGYSSPSETLRKLYQKEPSLKYDVDRYHKQVASYYRK